MTLNDLLIVVSAVAVSFGGGAVIVISLSGWLGNLWAKRILQNESAVLQINLEHLRHEMALSKSSYEHYLDITPLSTAITVYASELQTPMHIAKQMAR